MSDPKKMTQLVRTIAKQFNSEEVKMLCFELGVSYDDIEGEGNINKVRELVAYLERRQKLHELITLVKKERPSAIWPPPTPIPLQQEEQDREPSPQDGAYKYDAYISYTHVEPDAQWVWQNLLPHLQSGGLQIAVSGVAMAPGVPVIASIEQAIEQSRRVVLVLSSAYLADNLAHFQNILAQTMGIEERKARVFPIIIEAIDKASLRGGLRMLTMLDLVDPYLGDQNFNRLVALLKVPLVDG
ncbi:MAG: TIR domain-containing protein [Chloroflexi bacterium]|nr:MAG: TIR domain-containing protein [Chloroflexota bacterium]